LTQKRTPLVLRQALPDLTYMNTKQQIIRVDAGNVLDGLFDRHTTQHPDEVRNLVVDGLLLPVRSQERKQRHCVPHGRIFNPAQVGQDFYRRDLPAPIA